MTRSHRSGVALASILLVFLQASPFHARATNVLNIFAGSLSGSTGTAIAPGALLQLVDLGADGIFNPIRLDDGDTGALGQWVSGDDRLLNVPYATAPDFPTAAAFDLAAGSDPMTGIMDRVFEFSTTDVPLGTKIGVRWFPTLLAANFSTVTLAGGESYGEFSRQSAPRYGGELWRVPPADGSNVTFDALATLSIMGQDANEAGMASFAVLVPEPASGAFLLTGCVVLLGWPHRRIQRRSNRN